MILNKIYYIDPKDYMKKNLWNKYPFVRIFSSEPDSFSIIKLQVDDAI